MVKGVTIYNTSPLLLCHQYLPHPPSSRTSMILPHCLNSCLWPYQSQPMTFGPSMGGQGSPKYHPPGPGSTTPLASLGRLVTVLLNANLVSSQAPLQLHLHFLPGPILSTTPLRQNHQGPLLLSPHMLNPTSPPGCHILWTLSPVPTTAISPTILPTPMTGPGDLPIISGLTL